MPEIRAALIRVADAHAALQRGGNAWNATQLTDALTSAEFFIKAAREAMDNYTPPKPMPVSARGLQAEGRPVDAYEAALNASGANVNPAPHYAKPPPPPAPPPPQEWGG